MPKMQSAFQVLSALLSPASRKTLVLAARSREWLPVVECPCCGFQGKFDSSGVPVQLGTLCPSCKSRERHRLFYLAHQAGAISFKDKDVLHFAPEGIVRKLIESDGPRSYLSADIEPGLADTVLNIEAIELPAASLDRIICFHVLEHVDDGLALKEMYRVLRPGGVVAVMVPIIEGWSQTYENPLVQSPLDRERHFGLRDHLRYFGADLRQRLTAPGFTLSEFTAFGAACVDHALGFGEKVFLAQKP